MNNNFKVIDLTSHGIKPESTAPEADGLTTRSFGVTIDSYIHFSVLLRLNALCYRHHLESFAVFDSGEINLYCRLAVNRKNKIKNL